MTEKEKSLERFVKISSSKDLKELMSHFDYEKELALHYESGLQLAPDRELFIRDRIKSLEDNLQRRRYSFSWADGKSYEFGDYARVGYSWVIKGIPGSPDRFQDLARKNITLNAEVPSNYHYSAYNILLAEMARGASTAFHVSFLYKELAKTSSTNQTDMRMNHQLPVFHIDKNDRLWLKTVLESGWNNKRLTYRQIRSVLKDSVPVNYDSKQIPIDLMSENGEQITILGIIEAESSDSVLRKCDKILKAIQNILIEAATDEKMQATTITEITSLPLNEVTFLLYVLNSDLRLFSGGGSTRPSDYMGYDFISFDDARYRSMLQIENTVQAILEQRRKHKLDQLEDNLPSATEYDKKKHATAVQVLAVHYLLKQCKVNAIDNLTPATRLVQLLTGREINARRPQDTTIFKHVREPFKLNDRSLIKDLQTIRPYFVDLGLDEIVEEIDLEIKKSQETISEKPSQNRKSG